MSSTPPPPLDPKDPRAADPTNPASWLILGGLLLGGGLIGTITLLNGFSGKPTPASTTGTPAPSPSGTSLATPTGSFKLIFEGSGDGTITNPASNRQNFAGATAHVQWHLEYFVGDGSASAADVQTATITGTGRYRTYDGSGTCSATAERFGDYPELRPPRTSASAAASPSATPSLNTFLVYPPLGYSYALDGTCPAFTAAFGGARDFEFTVQAGVDRIPIPTQSFDQTLFLPGPRHMTLTWSGTITVIPQ